MKSIEGFYSIEVNGYDWGCAVDKVIVTLNEKIDNIASDSFEVEETKKAGNFEKVTIANFKRKILDAYLVKDEKKTNEPSNQFALILNVSPTEGNPIFFNYQTMFNGWSHPYKLSIKAINKLYSNQKEVSVNISQDMRGISTCADEFNIANYDAKDGVSYQYAYYNAKDDSDTLLVWLHGMGEGGCVDTDPLVTVLANKVTALIKDLQKVCPINVVVPQCSTYWMDEDGNMSNLLPGKGLRMKGYKSYYTKSLIEFIDYYKDKIQAKKVILAGCSNGGYMTMLLALKYPHKFDAIIPICEALKDECITDEKLVQIKDLPMYFVYADNDPIVVPSLHAKKTIERLKALNANNLYVSVTDNVIDTSGKYFDENNQPYQYSGHWSWIYFFNDQCNANGKKVFDFINDIARGCNEK